MIYFEHNISAGKLLAIKLAIILLGIIIGWMFYNNIFIGLLLGIFLSPLRKVFIHEHIQKKKNTLLIQFKDLVYSLSAAVGSGRSLKQGLEESLEFWEDTYDENDYIIIELKNMKKRMEEANETDISLLRDFAYRSGIQDIYDFVSVCEICKESGGDFARAIIKAGDVISEKITIERELEVIVSQKKFEGRIVGLAPFVLIFFIKLLSPSYIAPLYETPSGIIVSTMAIGLIVAGWLFIEKLNRIDI